MYVLVINSNNMLFVYIYVSSYPPKLFFVPDARHLEV